MNNQKLNLLSCLLLATALSCSGGSKSSPPGPNPNISCTPGETRACYTGAVGTQGVGPCQGGIETCSAAGNSFSACVGEVVPAAENCATKDIDEDCDNDADDNFCPGETVWSRNITGAQSKDVRSAAVDPDGNILISGGFGGSVDFGTGALASSGAHNVFVAKYDSTGTPLWSRAFGDSNVSRGIAWEIKTDNQGNVVIAGSYNGGEIDFGNGALVNAGSYDGFVAKFDPAGNALWSKRFGDADFQTVDGLDLDAEGNVVISGSMRGSADFGGGVLTSAGDADAFVAKFIANGDLAWARRFGDAASQSADAVAVDPNGNVILGGGNSGTIDFGGGALATAGDSDAFIAKFGPDATLVWSRQYGDADYQYVFDLESDALGNVIASGGFSGEIDFGSGALIGAGSNDIFLVKLSRDAVLVWNRRYGGTGLDLPARVDARQGSVVLTGSFSDAVDFAGASFTSFGDQDGFALKLSDEGDFSWARQFGGTGLDSGYAVSMDAQGTVFIAGNFNGTVDFGLGSVVAPGLDDIFLVKLGQ